MRTLYTNSWYLKYQFSESGCKCLHFVPIHINAKNLHAQNKDSYEICIDMKNQKQVYE